MNLAYEKTEPLTVNLPPSLIVLLKDYAKRTEMSLDIIVASVLGHGFELMRRKEKELHFLMQAYPTLSEEGKDDADRKMKDLLGL